MPAPKGNKYAKGCETNGRPPKYTDLPKLGELMLEWFTAQARAKNLPFFSRFARENLGICEDTLRTYIDQNEEFSGSYQKCKEIQKEFIIEQTLAGKYNPTFAIFTAKNITDMRDVREVTAKVTINKVLEEIYDDL